MKSFFLLSVFSTVCFYQVFAQTPRFGIIAGTELSNYSINYSIEHHEYDAWMQRNGYDKGFSNFYSKLGFKLACEVEFPLSHEIFLVPELVFMQRGTKQDQIGNVIYDDNSRDTIFVSYSETINYLQIPVNVMYKREISPDVLICLYGGPYVGYAFSGKGKTKAKDGDRQWTNAIKFGYESGEYKTFDIGLTVGAGIEYLDYFLRIQYTHGLENLLNWDKANYNKRDDYQRNRSFGIAVGYLF
ncbi:MAG: PorT family protein [Dysgonamonadaceae bacterium]|jgi:hypothetical protein|nr:PorT family protein [Dysgonamonadaceae bacterium]